MSDFDLDQHITDMVEGMAEKHPRPLLGRVGLAKRLLETKILRASRDASAQDAIGRKAAKPMRYLEEDLDADVRRILLPPGAKR